MSDSQIHPCPPFLSSALTCKLQLFCGSLLWPSQAFLGLSGRLGSHHPYHFLPPPSYSCQLLWKGAHGRQS